MSTDLLRRRDFLWGAVTAAGVACGPGGGPGATRGADSGHEGDDTGTSDCGVPGGLSDQILACDEAGVLDLVLDELAAGTSVDDLYRALHLAACRACDDRVGGWAHALYGVEATHRLMGQALLSGADAWMPMLWSFAEVVQAAAGVYEVHDALDEALFPDPDQAASAFMEAVLAEDTSSAEYALVAVYRGQGQASALSALLEAAALRGFDGAHPTIRCAHALHALSSLGWEELGEESLRVVARGLAESPNPNSLVELDPDLVARVPEGWETAETDLDTTHALLSTIRTGSTTDTLEQAVDLLEAGVGAGPLLHAALIANADFAVYMSSADTHCQHLLTSADAYRALAELADSSETRLRFLLLSLGAAARFFESAYERGASPGGAELIELSVTSGTLEEAWALVDEERVTEACSVALGVVQDSGDPWSLLGQAAEVIVSREGDAHGMKHLLALATRWEEVPETIRDRWFAASLTTIRFRPSFDEWWLLEEARAAAEVIEALG